MRKAFVETVSRLLDEDPRVVVLLGDISVHAFREANARHPKRVINCGINEQAMVSMAAGLARAGMYPIVHTIAPFLVERAFEQLKIDFGFNGLPGCFVSVGASYDYAGLGCTHHCPGDVALMLTIPGMEVYVPGHPGHVVDLLPKITDGALAYLRLSDDDARDHGMLHPGVMTMMGLPMPGKYTGTKALVIAIGPLSRLLPLDVNIECASVVAVHLLRGLRERPWPRKILVLEPFYSGTVTHLIQEAFRGREVAIKSIGVPRKFITDYGTRQQFDEALGFTRENVAHELEQLLHA